MFFFDAWSKFKLNANPYLRLLHNDSNSTDSIDKFLFFLDVFFLVLIDIENVNKKKNINNESFFIFFLF